MFTWLVVSGFATYFVENDGDNTFRLFECVAKLSYLDMTSVSEFESWVEPFHVILTDRHKLSLWL